MTEMECVGWCGGVSCDFWKHITENLNKYAQRNKKWNGYFGDVLCKDAPTEYMFHLIRILIKNSVGNRSICGYTSYFQVNISVVIAQGYLVLLTGYKAWGGGTKCPLNISINSWHHSIQNFTSKNVAISATRSVMLSKL